MEKITFQDINEAFEHLQSYAKQYQQKDLQNELQAKIDRLAGDCKIAIVANKNAGKKTFIKALGGKLSLTDTLPDADIALFVFDYEQLDANLSNDEQGLWHTIQERIAKDRDFDVFFVLNKIDMALNGAESKGDWFYNKQKAIDKLKNVAIEYGISNPQIYPVSSLYALLYHKTDKSFNDENDDKLEDFKKKFRDEFDNEWENELIKYLGIDAFTENINAHIKSQKRLGKLAVKIIKEIVGTEIQRIEKELLLYIESTVYEEVSISHKNSTSLNATLDGYNMQDLFREINLLHNVEIQQLENNKDKIKKMNNVATTPKDKHRVSKNITKQAIAFLRAYLYYEYDKQKATLYAADSSQHFELSAFHKIDVTHQRNLKIGDTLQDTLQDFIQKQLNKIGVFSAIHLPQHIITYYYRHTHWAINGCSLSEYIEEILNHTTIHSPSPQIIFNDLIEKKKKHLAMIQDKITKLQEILEKKLQEMVDEKRKINKEILQQLEKLQEVEKRKKNERKDKMKQLIDLQHIQNLL